VVVFSVASPWPNGSTYVDHVVIRLFVLWSRGGGHYAPVCFVFWYLTRGRSHGFTKLVLGGKGEALRTCVPFIIIIERRAQLWPYDLAQTWLGECMVAPCICIIIMCGGRGLHILYSDNLVSLAPSFQ
jgi:hypothetical protein